MYYIHRFLTLNLCNIYHPGVPSVRHHHTGDNQTTQGLKVSSIKEELSSNINTPKMWENYENSESTKPLNEVDSDEDSSPAIALPGFPGVHS